MSMRQRTFFFTHVAAALQVRSILCLKKEMTPRLGMHFIYREPKLHAQATHPPQSKKIKILQK
jgi:hypothetical protein